MLRYVEYQTGSRRCAKFFSSTSDPFRAPCAGRVSFCARPGPVRTEIGWRRRATRAFRGGAFGPARDSNDTQGITARLSCDPST